MWKSIKAFFGVGDDDDDGTQDQNNNSNEHENPKTTADQIREANAGLDKLRLELEQVEKAIQDAKTLVAKANTQHELFVKTLACLEMECHDEYLHPDWTDQNNNSNNHTNDDDQQQPDKIEERNRKQQLAKHQLGKLRQAIEMLRSTYLPQIEEQKDALDLNAFRLTLRLQKLKAEEADSRRRVAALQAEAHERWGKYTVNSNNNTNGGTSLETGEDGGGRQEEEEEDHETQIRIIHDEKSAAAAAANDGMVIGSKKQNEFSPAANDFVPPPPDVVIKK
jgi:chromosome segregation ATPase